MLDPPGAEDPSDEELIELHFELLAGDPTAPAVLAAKLLPALSRRFLQESRWDSIVEPVQSLIGKSVAEYLANPHRYDSTRGALLPWLYMDIRGDIANAKAKDRRRSRRQTDFDFSFADIADGGKLSVEEEVLDRVDPVDRPQEVVDLALAEVADWTDEERGVMQLIAAGVRSTSEYAVLLGVDHLSTEAQAQVVKNEKDKLNKRIKTLRTSDD